MDEHLTEQQLVRRVKRFENGVGAHLGADL